MMSSSHCCSYPASRDSASPSHYSHNTIPGVSAADGMRSGERSDLGRHMNNDPPPPPHLRAVTTYCRTIHGCIRPRCARYGRHGAGRAVRSLRGTREEAGAMHVKCGRRNITEPMCCAYQGTRRWLRGACSCAIRARGTGGAGGCPAREVRLLHWLARVERKEHILVRIILHQPCIQDTTTGGVQRLRVVHVEQARRRSWKNASARRHRGRVVRHRAVGSQQAGAWQRKRAACRQECGRLRV